MLKDVKSEKNRKIVDIPNNFKKLKSAKSSKFKETNTYTYSEKCKKFEICQK